MYNNITGSLSALLPFLQCSSQFEGGLDNLKLHLLLLLHEKLCAQGFYVLKISISYIVPSHSHRNISSEWRLRSLFQMIA